MKLRVVSGTLKGRMISIPERDRDFRPTQERIRESAAAILTNDIYDAVVADVCAGSGAFGFEMLSRGARHAVFIENDRFRCNLIKKHAGQFGVAGQCSAANQEVSAFVARCTDRFDIIYYDPPYDEPAFENYLQPLHLLLSSDGILIYERRRSTPLSEKKTSIGNAAAEIRSYGETEICIFRKRLLRGQPDKPI
jgi:16S rRNA (guanine966-N2)-methyltransferase